MGRTPSGDEWSDGNSSFDDDPWLVGPLDDDFVNAASVVERSADERVAELIRAARARELLDTLTDIELGGDRTARRRRRVLRAVIGLFVVGALFAGAVASQWGANLRPVASPPDELDLGDPQPDTWVSTRLPTPGGETQTTPLGRPAAIPDTTGTHRFVAVQPDGSTPVAYDPCREIHYVTNARTAPDEGDALVAEAFTILGDATGLRFVDDGATTEAPADARNAFQPDRYGDRWAPVLVAWTDPAETTELADDVLGSAGSVRLGHPNGVAERDEVYVTGSVNLDGPDLAAILDQERRGDAKVLAVILHELGHLVGLDHVDDRNELMFPSTGERSSYGPGDRHGLAALGKGACFPDV